MLTKDVLITFCQRNDKYKEKFCHILDSETLSATDFDKTLDYLCEFLMDPQCTNDVADCFPQILPALMLMAIPAIEKQEASTENQDLIHRLNCVILGQLFIRNHNLFTYTLRYFDHNPAPFETTGAQLSTSSSKKRKVIKMHPITEVTDYDIVLASYNILRTATSHFKYKWDWSKIYKYAKHPDDKVKWYAIKCIGIILEMSEPLKIACAKSMLNDYKKFMIDYDENTVQTESPVEEFSPSNSVIDGVSSVVSVGNVLLPVIGKSYNDSCNLVPVPSMEENLRSLAVAVASKKCICLQGAVGCGKTALVEYLAQVTGHDSSNFVKVQLGDQTDSKMLLGMYRCTDIPGEFVWQPGVLTEAVTAGKWLLLEDIDSAALDVASILSNLIETGTLSVPGYRDTIYAKTGFQLFVTQRLVPSATGLQRQASGALNLLEKHWLSINVEPLSKSELITVIQILFPVLSTVATRMVDVYLLFSMGFHEDDNSTFDGHLRTGRQTSTRDLIKWCSRSIIDFDVSSPDSGLKLFQDALDVFCYSVPDQAHRLKLAIAVAHKLGIVKTKAEFFCNMYKPTISLLPEFFVAGRAKLPRKMVQYASLSKEKTNFSFTRPSACLLERITSCIVQKEPVLLVGETGTGKTSAVQYLARSTGHKLVVINMNQQSESADLLGGYKPVDFKFLVSPIREEFEILFRTYFAVEPNKKFLDYVATCYKQQKWSTLVKLMNHSTLAAVKRLKSQAEGEAESDLSMGKPKEGQKRRHQKPVTGHSDTEQLRKWKRLATKLQKLESQVKTQYSLAFAFIEGTLIKALRNGHWVLLDEINLANAETLECLSGLLERSSGSLSLLERGDKECVKRHKDFTIFACMNPATDVGKRDLPVGLRNRFTEFYVDELTAHSDLELLVNSYLKELNLPGKKHEAIVKFYTNIRKQATTTLFDGTAHKPLYSLRTLCRALNVSAVNPCGNVLRSLYEAFSLSFLTQLDYKSYPIVQKLIGQAVLDSKTQKAILGSPIPKPRCGPDEDYICFEGYWVVKGSLEPETPANYILTPSVRRNLKDLVRVVSIGKIPILLQGDTSVGKTSLITYLAKASGHVCMRINNHEHTDLQEYVGSYVADSNGKLVFQEGVLVEAMRKGYWIILDELNLAPSDVLEALNRVLDDNRELYIPETQQTVKAHDNFMLFATQNPPGLYGGRKVLSRAFRNRFVELHFDEIPASELQIILHERCSMPETYCKQIISVMTDLQMRRKSTAAFAGKQGFITLRDLFRWGERYRLAPDMGEKLYDWHQHLADEGYLVLSAKVRKTEEAEEIRQVIKKHMKRDVDPNKLFTLNEETSTVTRSILEELLNSANSQFKHIVWTYHMRRMAVLVKKSCQFKEPVLLVGETGGGKTTVCQLIAAINNQNMHCVNCHMHTESSDFLGNLRPVREHNAEGAQKLFEWVDGPLISAMRNGDLFLADEISLADDSVLERLNSLLEPERSLLLAERGSEAMNGDEIENVIIANEKFIFIGTMNPGGDYGKRELSPALRNRFTEVWCEGCMVMDDLRAIIEHNVHVSLQSMKESIARAMLNFVEWFPATEIGKKFVVSIRDVLTWVNFVNTCIENNERAKLSIGDAYYHGACLTYVDSLGSGLTGSENVSRLKEFRDAAMVCIETQIKDVLRSQLPTDESMEVDEVVLTNTDDMFGIPPFYIQKGDHHACADKSFTFTTPTTSLNTLKLLRALQLKKPILLEGSPGVGKTSLVSALAKASGYTLLRINLSDQTDVSDLFGADLPVEGGKSGQFAWKDGPFLRALRAGHWILLDELNLASQSVLEGLNACFDHRGEVYIPELDKSFSVKPGTRLFGCQNPLRQGGSRRGLPKSFLNRFTQVFVDALVENDLELILSNQFPQLDPRLVQKMVKFNSKIAGEAGVSWGFIGSPWELNLRDITRWCESMIKAAESRDNSGEVRYNPGCSVDLIYAYRMRTEEDREKVRQIYQEMFPAQKYPRPLARLPAHITEDKLYVGDVSLSRTNSALYTDCNLLLLRDQKVLLRSLMQCVELNWMSILVGGSGCGKSSLVRLLASLVGQKLRSIAVNSAMDTTEILGGFEQTDYNRHLEQLFEKTEHLVVRCLRSKINRDNLDRMAEYHGMLEKVRHMSDDEDDAARTMMAETKLFLKKIEELAKLVAAMKAFEPADQTELEEIEDKLKKLSQYVKEDRCLNAGGKFEWIDSVLVECLRDGTWLLIDQVNLCNPAVLDRLNGLLEPNGVLSIGERGVDGEGNIVTIRPHKNFRLFLTMDPRYGEISRAMRNRGVEIYLLGPKENVEYNDLDLRSMLHSVGLTSHSQQSVLLEIHRSLAQELISVERLTVVELIHSAFLARQQILCGFPTRQSIRSACIDVYIKAKSIRDPRLKDRFTAIIEEVIERLLSSTNHLLTCFDLNAATWSIQNLQDNRKLTIVRQQGLLLSTVIERYKLGTCPGVRPIEVATTAFINEFLGLRVDDEAILDAGLEEILPYLLLNFYELSSRNDVEVRRRWISRISAGVGSKEVGELVDKSADLSDEIALFDFRSANDFLPWDLLQLSNVRQDLTDDNLCDANRLALILYLRAMVRFDDDLLAETVPRKGEETMSVTQYSNAIYHEKLSTQLKNQPLITDYVSFVAQLRKTVDWVLRDSNFSINTSEYVEFRNGMQWCARYRKLGEMTLVNKSQKSRDSFPNLDEISLLLRVHYKWLSKFVRRLLAAHLCDVSSSDIIRLTTIMRDFDNKMMSAHDPFRKLSKMLKKYLILPLPHTSEDSMQVHLRLKKLSNDFTPWLHNAHSLKRELKVLFIGLSDTILQRHKVISLWNDLYFENTIDHEALDNISEVEDFSQKNHLALNTPTDVAEVLHKINAIPDKEIRNMSAKIQLWPIYEYMFMLYSQALQTNLCQGISNDSTNMSAMAKFASVPSIPINIIGILSAASKESDDSKRKLLLLPELFVWLEKLSEQSYAFRNPDMLLHFDGVTEQDLEASITSCDNISSQSRNFLDGPILVHLILELMLNRVKQSNDPLAATTLGSHAARTNQLKCLNEILWRNSVALTSNQYSFRHNDLTTLKFYVNLYISAIQKMNTEHDMRTVMDNLIKAQTKYGKTEMEEKFNCWYVEPVEELERTSKKLESENENDPMIRGKCWMLLGSIQMLFFGNLGYIDPVQKVGLKLTYLEEDIADCKKLIYVSELQSRILGTALRDENCPSRIVEVDARLRSLSKEMEGVKSLKAFRPSCADFATLAKETDNFRNSVCTHEILCKHAEALTNAAGNLRESRTGSSLRAAEEALQEAEMWKSSVQRFSEQLEAKYLAGYPDIVLPLLSALNQIKHGACILTNEVKRALSLARIGVDAGTMKSLIYNLARYPTIGKQQESILNLISLCTSTDMKAMIGKTLSAKDRFRVLKEQFKMLKCGLCELYNYVALNRELTQDLWRDLNALLHQVVMLWKQQEDENEKRKAEKDSLYKNKAEIRAKVLSDDEQIAIELRQLFPTYREQDFGDVDDMNSPSLEGNNPQRPSTDTEINPSYSGLITEEEIAEIQEIHSTIVTSFITSSWLNCNVNNSPNYVQPLIQRYHAVGLLLNDVTSSLDEGLSSKLYNSLNFLATLVADSSGKGEIQKNFSVGAKRTRVYDYYRDPNVEEAKSCIPLLDTILIRINQLLEEWPEHPTLRSIRLIIDRIYGFPVTSSISRFLTGLELLLVKMHQWEENAHSGVSLLDYTLQLTQQIISWRQLELACWKDCLNTAQQNLKRQASKWWFHLYSLVEGYLLNSDTEIATGDSIEDGQETITKKKMIESLERFVNESSLIEFEARLDLLRTFHCHVYYFDSSPRKNELLAILWNLYNYYKQFISDVNAKIAGVKAPVEKKLKDFVKIARWNDISYWAVKETVEKTHRTLHKFTKEFETNLKQSASSCLAVKPDGYNAEASKGIWDDQAQTEYLINPADFTVNKSPKSSSMKDTFTKCELISRADSLLNKAKHLCKEVILLSSYPCIRIEIENFIQDFMEHSVRLRNQEIDRTQTKEKQKSQAKYILQQKKLALSNYFKILTRMGVSYRTGNLTWKNDFDKVVDFAILPLDLSGVSQYFTMKETDEQMLVQWSGCERYYYKSVIKLNALGTMLKSTQTDIGPQNADRCLGFSAHIMLMANRQKATLAELFDYLVSLRMQVSNLSQMDENNLNIPRQRDLKDSSESLKKLLITLETGFEQVELYLQCCPEEASSEARTDDILILDNNYLPIQSASQGSETWQNTKSLIGECLSTIKTLIKRYDTVFAFKKMLSINKNHAVFFTPKHFMFLKDSYAKLQDLSLRVKDLSNVFGRTDMVHPMLDSIDFLQSQINENVQNFEKLQRVSEDELEVGNNEIESYEQNVEALISNILLVIQKKYKEYMSINEELLPTRDNAEDESETAEDDEKEQISENRFKEELVESLQKDVKNLSIEKICERLNGLLFAMQEFDTKCSTYCNRLLLKCIPFLRQYTLLVQYYLNEQVASFRITCKMLYLQLNVFLDLAMNGFCVPKDLDVEEGEGDQMQDNRSQGGMGLGDGEGQKDVSDRIESEDQLEDARPANEEKEKPEDKDCKEEEQGIEMSEDFDSKLQDMEKDENDEEDDKDEEDELDKEMGETSEGADQLDKEIWGEDKEESGEENNNPEEKDEGEGQGEETGEKEMGAKDDKNKHNDEKDNDNAEGERQEEEKKEINEMDEPETNEDQIDPYHGTNKPPPEPEPLDLPDDINLDDDDGKEEQGGNEENPFDVDEMKEARPPPEKDEEEANKDGDEEQKEADPAEDSSDDDDDEGEKVRNDHEKEDITEDDPEKETDDKAQGEDAKENEKEDEDKDKEENKEGEEEKAAPSASDPSKETDASEEVDNTEGSKDKVAQQESQNEEQQEIPTENNQDDSSNKGTGQAQSEEQNSGHTGSSAQKNVPIAEQENVQKEIEKRKNPGKSDENRSLVDNVEPERKKLKVMHSKNELRQEEDAEDSENPERKETEMCEHVKNSEKFDDVAMDAATEEQVKQQASNMETEQEEQEKEDDSMVIDLDEDDDKNEEEDVDAPKQNPEKLEKSKSDKSRKDAADKDEDPEEGQVEGAVVVEGDVLKTSTVERGNESAYYTKLLDSEDTALTSKQIERRRFEIEKMLSEWTHVPSTQEASTAWNFLSTVTDTAARDLSEKLRLVLEPTQASRLKGDYKTGRRINMRKIIPYIASEFRKDKIWLRRTKPSKRDYQIILAIDDSSSMADNHSKELAFESLSLISKAMTYLEAGQLGVISFGEEVNVLHPLGETFTEQSGARLIQEMQFEQKKTMIGQLVDFIVDMFEGRSGSSDNAKLLVVLSDGRGIYSEGIDKVNYAIRRARLADIFLVFIIVENPTNKDSILDIRMPIFEGGKLKGIRSYMDNFPFPFYMILRDINMLPGVLSDALRQWFEIVGKIDT